MIADTGRTRGRERAVASACAVAPVAVVAAIGLATRMTPSYSSVSDTLSQLAVAGRPHPAMIGAGLLVAGTMLLGFAWTLHRRIVDRARANRIGISIAVAGVAVAGAAVIRD